MISTAVADQAPTASAQPNTATIVLSRRFDVHEVPCFDAEVDRVSAPGTLVIIDASAVRYLDQAGLDALMQARLRCIDRGGDATIADLSVAARVILELTGRYEALAPRLAAA